MIRCKCVNFLLRNVEINKVHYSIYFFLYIMPNAGSKSQMRLALLVFISCNKLRLAKTVALSQISLVSFVLIYKAQHVSTPVLVQKP